MVPKVILATWVQLALQVQKEAKAPQVRKEVKEIRAHKVRSGLMDTMVILEPRVQPVLLEPRVPWVKSERKEIKAQSGIKETPATQVLRVLKET
jgi:hypothetical protein